jgi:hypothetical protein
MHVAFGSKFIGSLLMQTHSREVRDLLVDALYIRCIRINTSITQCQANISDCLLLLDF